MATATARLRTWFLTITATAVKRGTRLKSGDRPTEATFADLLASNVMKSEPDDKASEDATATALVKLNGHVVLATDEQAKANQAKKTDRSLVVQPSQLPTVDAVDVIDLGEIDNNFNGEALDVTVDESVLTKNVFLIKFTTEFTAWLSSILGLVNSLLTRMGLAEVTISNNTNRIVTLEQSIPGTPSIGAYVQEGTVSMWMSSTPVPAGYIPLLGQTLLITDYQALSDILGSQYNVGIVDAGYFMVPNMSDKTIMQVPTAGGTIGEKIGDNLRLLQGSDLPNHDHDNSFSISGAGTHEHGIKTAAASASFDGSGAVARGNDQGFSSLETNGSLGKGNGSHDHTISGSVGGIKNQGTQSYVDNRQSSVYAMYIMRATLVV